MIRSTAFLLRAVLLLTLAPLGLAQNEPQVVDIAGQRNPATFDVLGVKLGMSAKEVTSVLARRYPAVRPQITEQANTWTPKARHVETIFLNPEGGTLLLNFVESYPLNPAKPEQLTVISYQLAFRSSADLDAIAPPSMPNMEPPSERARSRRPLGVPKD